MGVTTIVAGNCGSSALDVGEALASISRTGPSINFATLIGHNTVRSARSWAPPTACPPIPELAQMRSLVWRAMADGAVGFSTGLQYVPGTYAKTPEIIDLARVAGNAGGVYATHMRNEGTALEAAVEESIRVGLTTGARVQISHLKVDSPSRWGASEKALAMIDAARSPRRRRHGRSVRLHGGQLDARHPFSVLGARRRAAGNRRAPERSRAVGAIKKEMTALLAERGLKRSVVRGRRVTRRQPAAERPDDEAGRGEAAGIRLRRRAVRGGARADARGRRLDGLSLHVRRGRRSDHAAPVCRVRVGQRRADAGPRRAAPARLRQQRARARRVRRGNGT